MLTGQLRKEELKISMVVVFFYCMTNCCLATSAVFVLPGAVCVVVFIFFCFLSIFFTCVGSVPVRRGFSTFWSRAAVMCTWPECGHGLFVRERLLRRLIFLFIFSP